MKNFDGFGLSETLLKSIHKMGFTAPTPIQARAIPMALDGRDILGSAQTGTGKTAAFSIPLIEFVMSSSQGALVLTPTRELAKQVLDAIHEMLGYKSNINTAFIIGGDSMGKQIAQLKKNPQIIVGTPGRINDHLQRGSISLKKTGFLVLDETDRMLDMGFGVQLDKIAKHLPKKRQTLMFSATLPKEIIKISEKYLNNPQRVSVGETNVVAVNIKQEVIRVEQDQKYKELTNQLYERDGSVIVFIKTKYAADRMAKNLRRDGFTSEALHGDLRQNKRDRVMKNFHAQNFRILIATDIAARGLDVPHIEHVINYDLPQVAEDYIHRMGRTARNGATGSAISFVSNQDGRKWFAIECLLDPNKKSEKRSAPKKSKKFGNKSRKKPFTKNNSKYDERQDKNARKANGKPKRKSADGGNGENRKTSGKKPYEGGKPGKPNGKKPFSKTGARKSKNGKSFSKNKPNGAKRKNFSKKRPSFKKAA